MENITGRKEKKSTKSVETEERNNGKYKNQTVKIFQSYQEILHSNERRRKNVLEGKY